MSKNKKQKRIRQYLVSRCRNRCQTCGSNVNVEVHHIIPTSAIPDRRYAIDNLKLLCHDCHLKEHGHEEIKPVRRPRT